MIPVCVPDIGEKERDYVVDCIDTNWISSKGKYVTEFEEQFSAYCGCEYGISTMNGTTALHLALASLDIKKGDEVIMPAFTMIATAFAVCYCGAKPVLVDAEPETWNMDVDKIEEKITPSTKAILPVHIYGHPSDMDVIMDLAEEHDLYVVEDAAETHGAEYKGQKAGGMGDIGCFSFYANKIITCGEGGMMVTNDERVAERAQSLKNLDFPKDKRIYVHEKIGYNYRMTNIQAAIGLAQFSRIDELIEKRRKNASLYNHYLRDTPGIVLPVEKEWAKNVYWMYSILIDGQSGVTRDDLMDRLAKCGVETRPFFTPMNQQPVFQKMGYYPGQSYPVAEMLGNKGVNLPSGSGLKPSEIEFVSSMIGEILGEGS